MRDRDLTLDAEFLRTTPGLRPFSVGILSLCRQLGLRLATGETGGDSAREMLAVAWLLDERNKLATIRTAPADPAAFARELDAYEFAISPAFLVAVREEVARTNRAVEAASVQVAPKPGGTAGPAPPGNS